MNAQTQITAPSQQSVGLLNLESFELSQRIAKMLSSSTLVPEQYRATIQKKAGKDEYGNQQWREEPNPNGLSNCVIALNMSNRMGADPLMVMQNLYLVNGRPSWSSQFIMAGINSSGRFSALRFEIEDLGEKDVECTETVWENRKPKKISKTVKIHDFSCVAWAIERETGERLESSKITIEMAVKEGWYTKEGSKWQTMSEQMLRYRAASFFGRVYAPELLMGLRSAEEEQDRIIDVTPQGQTTVINASDFKHIKSLILKSKSIDALKELESSIYALSNESEREELIKLWNAHADKYKAADVTETVIESIKTSDQLKSNESEREELIKLWNAHADKYKAADVTETVIESIKTSDQLKKEFILSMNNSTNVDVLQGFIEMYKANETLTPAHKKYLDGVAEQNMAKFEGKTDSSQIDPTQSLNIMTKIKENIAQTNDVQVLETTVANEINSSKTSLTPGHHQDVLTTYAQRKEILSQGDIFADTATPSDNPVDRAIARIEKCQSQDDINLVWEEIENDPYLTRALSAEDRKLIEAAADRREAEIQG
ncbi:hypothetical protein [uncultured Acinetobacter sp.]|uniref:hypothetical protein n=1 Tax=uncultured Acinetobacter sp. TaxID=165433 RepID=UPI0025D0DC81|nr:hypothetical protein [uncultured Acinetobacter sp.]